MPSRKTPLTPAQKEASKKLLDDFEFYAKHCIKIRTKSGDILPLVLNRPQRRLLEVIERQLQTTGRVRVVVLKGRQQGFSTEVSAYIYWRTTKKRGQKSLVLAHVADSSDTLFDMYKRAHDECPELMKQPTKYSNKKELTFNKLDSAIIVRTAGGKGVARGETLQNMHLSEVAFWPKQFAKDNFNGLIKALPNEGSFCAVESTANGIGNIFHQLYTDAAAGTNDFEAFFSPWFDTPEYRLTPPDTFERTPEEQELAEKHGLDDAQLYWRRKEIGRDGFEFFKQEYPCTAEEAFITSGRPVFNTDVVADMADKAPEPLYRMAVEQFTDENGKVGWRLEKHMQGELLVYRERDAAADYVIGADVSVGIRDKENSDYCVAQVLDNEKRQVAVWRGQVTPDHYAHVLNTLGLYYNIALVAPERNGHGLLVCVRLYKDLQYPRMFTDVREGQEEDLESLNIGFQTNVSSKPLIIDKLRGEVRNREITLVDRTTLNEMLSFVVTDTGKMEGEQGCFDDCVMALAIANHIHEGKWAPVEVLDEHYTEAI